MKWLQRSSVDADDIKGSMISLVEANSWEISFGRLRVGDLMSSLSVVIWRFGFVASRNHKVPWQLRLPQSGWGIDFGRYSFRVRFG